MKIQGYHITVSSRHEHKREKINHSVHITDIGDGKLKGQFFGSDWKKVIGNIKEWVTAKKLKLTGSLDCPTLNKYKPSMDPNIRPIIKNAHQEPSGAAIAAPPVVMESPAVQPTAPTPTQ